MKPKTKAFTPLEKPHAGRKLISNGVRSRGSLTGFTLIEVLIAVAILAGGLLSALYMFPLGMRQLRISRALMDVSFFAKEKLEEIKTYTIVSDASGSEGDIEWQISLTDVSPAGGITLRKVTLKTTYHLQATTLTEEFITYLDPEEDEG
ncbi:prepilin-type N-terminal cleavage/methylation domain-containing protein [Candidatus Omnitrophota bacterium]